MLLSTFELLVKKIAPPTITQPFNRLAVQGYFLTVSNINLTRDISIYLRLTIPIDDPVDMNETVVDREFVNQNANVSPSNHVVAFDINGINNFSQLSGNTTPNQPYKRYNTRRVVLRRGQTVSIQILPNIGSQRFFGNSNFTGNPTDYNLFIRSKMEIRGFVEIFQTPINPLNAVNDLPETDVLVTPEIRGTFFPDATIPVIDQDFDQINYSLPIADGKSKITLEPIIIGPKDIAVAVDGIREL